MKTLGRARILHQKRSRSGTRLIRADISAVPEISRSGKFPCEFVQRHWIVGIDAVVAEEAHVFLPYGSFVSIGLEALICPDAAGVQTEERAAGGGIRQGKPIDLDLEGDRGGEALGIDCDLAAIETGGGVGGGLNAHPERLVFACSHAHAAIERRKRVGPVACAAGFVGGDLDIHISDTQHFHGISWQQSAGLGTQFPGGGGQTGERFLRAHDKLGALGFVASHADADRLALRCRQRTRLGDFPSRGSPPEADFGRRGIQQLAIVCGVEDRLINGRSQTGG